MAAAAILERWRRVLVRYREPVFVVGLCGLIASTYLVASRFEFYQMFVDHWIVYAFRPIATVALVCMVIGLALESSIAQKVFANKVILYLGTISYSIYLWHLVPLIGKFYSMSLEMTHSDGATRALAVLITLAIASASYFVIEGPFQRLGHLDANHAAKRLWSRYDPLFVLFVGGLIIMLITVGVNGMR